MLASRIFVAADQSAFASLTGDYNPMHLDPIAARRTSAGAPVVHGIHTLLWLLDIISAHHPEIETVAAIKVRFSRMVYVGDRVEVWIVQCNTASLRAHARVDGVEVVSVVLGLGTLAPAASQLSLEPLPRLLVRQRTPADLPLHEMENRSGRIAFPTGLSEIKGAFPSATRLLGPSRIAAIGCSTYLVGMVVPGLHSIYGGLELRFTADATSANELQFVVTTVDSRFRRVQLKVKGPGLSGLLDAFARVPPVSQPSMPAIAAHVAGGEFDKSTALIVGGSRGLGELTAKLIAAGGGRVIITFAIGKVDAERVAAEINDWGGACDVIAYDVRQAADQQLEALKSTPSQLYYFATPTIFKSKSGFFAPERFTEFNEYYIQGFLRLLQAAVRRAPEGLRVFYPSTVFVQDRPQDMTEYAMSKAAGEILCADIARYFRTVRVLTERLPRLSTDQTTSLTQVDTVNSLSIMLPIIRKMHERIGTGDKSFVAS
jgi:hypothetical protein